MSYETQRGLLQLAIGACCLCFSLAMFARAHEEYPEFRWPLSWEFLVALWIASLAWSFIAHGLGWLEIGGASHWGDWRVVLPLYAVFGITLWCLLRWIRDGEDE